MDTRTRGDRGAVPIRTVLRVAARSWRWAEEHPEKAVALALVAATLVRLVHVIVLRHRLGGADGPTYDAAGWDIRRHGLVSSHVRGLPFWAPGYPMLIAAVYLLFGHQYFAVPLLQVGLVAGLTWATYALAKKVVSARAALLAGLGMSGSFAWLAIPHSYIYEPWLALFLVGTVLLLLEWDHDGRTRGVLLAGLLLGLACAFQNKCLTLVPFVAVWLALQRAFSSWRRAAAVIALVAGAAVVVAPLVWRNDVVYGEPIPIATKNGANALFGNNPDADGSLAIEPARPPWCPGTDIFDTHYISTDRRLFHCAAHEALAHPAHELRILPNKFVRFWAPFVGPWTTNWTHHVDVRKLFPMRVRSSHWFHRLDVAASLTWIGSRFALLVLGTVVVTRQRGARVVSLAVLPITWLLATHLLTFGDARFRIPVLPLDWTFEAAGIVTFLEWMARRCTAESPRPVAPTQVMSSIR